jgi:hypothetical protein
MEPVWPFLDGLVLTVTLKNKNNIPLQRDSVTISSTNSALLINGQPVVTLTVPADVNGQAIFNVQSWTPDIAIFTISDTTDNPSITISQNTMITFTSGIFPEDHSYQQQVLTYDNNVQYNTTVSVSPDSVPDDGQSTSTIIVSVGASSNPTAGDNVTLSLTSTDPTLKINRKPASTLTVKADANGQAVFNVSSLTAGIDNFTVADTSPATPLTINKSANVTFTQK